MYCIKEIEMGRLSWIIWVGPEYNRMVLIEGARRGQWEGTVVAEQRIKVATRS